MCSNERQPTDKAELSLTEQQVHLESSLNFTCRMGGRFKQKCVAQLHVESHLCEVAPLMVWKTSTTPPQVSTMLSKRPSREMKLMALLECRKVMDPAEVFVSVAKKRSCIPLFLTPFWHHLLDMLVVHLEQTLLLLKHGSF